MICYEWLIETMDGDDVKDVTHAATYKEALRTAAALRALGETVELGLVRERGDEAEGLQDRQWAYLEDGQLPECFDGGAHIPKRFRLELDAAQRG